MKRHIVSGWVSMTLVATVALLIGAAGCKKGEQPKTPAGEESKSALQKAGEKTGELARTAKEKTEAAAEVVKEKTVEAGSVIKEKTVEAVEKTKEGTKEFIEGVKQGYEGKTETPTEKSPDAPLAERAPEAAPVKAATYSVILTAGGDKLVEVLQAVREATGLGLADSQRLISEAPKPLKTGLSQADAEALQKKLEAAGAKVEVKQDTP